MKLKLDIDEFRLSPGTSIDLAQHASTWSGEAAEAGRGPKFKAAAKRALDSHRKDLIKLQRRLWAAGRDAVLVVLQGLDACGKDSTIRHVTSGVNPAGLQVASFQIPTEAERRHHFLRRYSLALPELGYIAVFNRSYYEDVIAARVHPDAAGLEDASLNDSFWSDRCDDINAFERHLCRERTLLIKCFMDVSAAEQRQRLLKRLRKPNKHWKFTEDDLRERLFWHAHVSAASFAVSATSTPWAPWYVIPADDKWFMRALVAQIIVDRLRDLDLSYPEPDAGKRAAMDQAVKALTGES